jgi:predicted permease
MNNTFLEILPPVVVFLFGYFLKRIRLLKRDDGDLLLLLVFYLAAPALILLSITDIKFSANLLYLLLIPGLVVLITQVTSFFIGKALRLQRASLGVFLVATMIMNTGFTLPFISSVYGLPGLARWSLFNLAVGVLTYSYIYGISCKYGERQSNLMLIVQKVFFSPVMWTIGLALVLNLLDVHLPSAAKNILTPLGNLAAPLIMLALGCYFNLNLELAKLPQIVAAIFIRMGLGLLLGIVFSWLFHLEGLTRAVVFVCAAAPVGYNTLTFVALEKLDKEFAASIVSLSILLGMFFTPMLLLLLI